ncbi:MAG: hypothetical protein ABIP21_03145 [Acidimicrobiia bacterium]
MVGTTISNEILPRFGPFAVPKRMARRARPKPSAAFGITVLLMVIAGCVAALSQLAVSRHSTSTPVQLRAGGQPASLVAPAQVAAGREVRLEVVGAKPHENVVFAITSPTGTFVGPSHLADDRGKVSTTYRPSSAAPLGTYRVVVLGDHGTGAESNLVVTSAH